MVETAATGCLNVKSEFSQIHPVINYNWIPARCLNTVTELSGQAALSSQNITPNLAYRWARINSSPDRSAPLGRVCHSCTLHPDLSSDVSQPRFADDLRSTESPMATKASCC